MPLATVVDINEDAIVAACKTYDFLNWIHPEFDRDEMMTVVIRYTADTIVKFGECEMTATNARNQAYAHQVLDPRIVRVPKVYHHFEAGEGYDRRGYTVMEYIEGKQCDWHPTSDEFQKIVAMIEHLATQHGKTVGPVGGGVSSNAMFDEFSPSIQTTAQLEKHFNERLLDRDGEAWCPRFWQRHDKVPQPLRFQQSDLVLVHGRISPAKILWCADGTPVLLDWSDAGFYPRYFEQACIPWQHYNGRGLDFVMAFERLGTLCERDEWEREKVGHANENTYVYNL